MDSDHLQGQRVTFYWSPRVHFIFLCVALITSLAHINTQVVITPSNHAGVSWAQSDLLVQMISKGAPWKNNSQNLFCFLAKISFQPLFFQWLFFHSFEKVLSNFLLCIFIWIFLSSIFWFFFAFFCSCEVFLLVLLNGSNSNDMIPHLTSSILESLIKKTRKFYPSYWFPQSILEKL